jgi:hypothetical protein
LINCVLFFVLRASAEKNTPPQKSRPRNLIQPGQFSGRKRLGSNFGVAVATKLSGTITVFFEAV